VLLNSLPYLFQFTVNRLFAQHRIEGGRVKKDVDVFRKPLNQIPALGQAGPTL
jgi:hypothetical protein